MTAKKIDIKKLSVVAMLCAVAYLCTLLFGFKVQFLTFDVKDAVITVASLLYGPLAGLISSFLVAFFELITFSQTGIYGFIMNFLSSATFSVVAGLIYKYRRSFFGAIISVIAAAFSATAVMLLANLFVTPFYMGVDRGVVINMLASLLLPFNMTKAILNGALTLVIYKPLTNAMRKARLLPTSDGNYKFGLKSVLLMLSAVVVIVLTLLFFVLYLNGTVEFFGT